METNNWKSLYKSASIITWLTIALIPIQIVIFIMWPPPSNEIGFYNSFHKNALIGLLNLDLLYLLTVVFMGYLYLAMFAALQESRKSMAVIALFLGVVGVAIYFVSNVSFEMLTLSKQYFSAQSIEEKQGLETIGKMLLLRYKGTAFGVYYILNGLSLIIFSFAMLKSENFNKQIATWGLVSGFLMLVPSILGIVGMVFALTSLIPTSVWLFMMAKKFNALAVNS